MHLITMLSQEIEKNKVVSSFIDLNLGDLDDMQYACILEFLLIFNFLKSLL